MLEETVKTHVKQGTMNYDIRWTGVEVCVSVCEWDRDVSMVQKKSWKESIERLRFS